MTNAVKIIRVAKSEQANASFLTASIVLGMLIICCGISEFLRLNIIVSGVRDGLQQAVIVVSVTNYDEVYNSLREGYSGGYILSGDNWNENLDYGDIYGRMDRLLGTVQQSNYHVKMQRNGYEYKYSELYVEITNTPLVPGNTNKNFEADAMIRLEVKCTPLSRQIFDAS